MHAPGSSFPRASWQKLRKGSGCKVRQEVVGEQGKSLRVRLVPRSLFLWRDSRAGLQGKEILYVRSDWRAFGWISVQDNAQKGVFKSAEQRNWL